MATWLSNNIVLTNQGLDILSKVQSGTGAITVSKVQTGGGFTAPASLKSLTTVNTPKQDMSIVSYETGITGSNLELVVRNTGVTTEYTLYQIGIYVTHPDYTGDVLYLVAQCEQTGADVIPTEEQTSVSLSYSLFMAHSGTTDVAITVSPTGILTTSSIGVAIPALDNVLTLDNTIEFTPTSDYHPTTKKYADSKNITVDSIQPSAGWWFKTI